MRAAARAMPARASCQAACPSAAVVIGQTSWQSVMNGASTTHFPRHALSETVLPCSSVSATAGTGRGRGSAVPMASGAGTPDAVLAC